MNSATSKRVRPRSAPGGRRRPKSGFDYVFDMIEEKNETVNGTDNAMQSLTANNLTSCVSDTLADTKIGGERREYRPSSSSGATLLERFEAVPVGPVISASRNGWRQYFISKHRSKNNLSSKRISAARNFQNVPVRGPGPSASEEAQQRWDRLEDLWEECKIPEPDRTRFSALYADNEIEVARHVKLLLEHRAATIHVLRCIRAREASVDRIRTLLATFDSAEKSEHNANLLKELVTSRDASLDVVEAIKKWREQLTGTKPFMWKGENYLLKMMADLEILGSKSASAVLTQLGLSKADLLLLHFPGGATSMLSQYGVLASDEHQKHPYWETERTATTASCKCTKDLKKMLVHAVILVQSEATYILNEKRGPNSRGPLLQWNINMNSMSNTALGSTEVLGVRPKSAGMAPRRRTKTSKILISGNNSKGVSDLIISSGQTVLAKSIPESDNILATGILDSVKEKVSRKKKIKKKRPLSAMNQPLRNLKSTTSHSIKFTRKSGITSGKGAVRRNVRQRPRSAGISGVASSSPLRAKTFESMGKPPPSGNTPFYVNVKPDPIAEQALQDELDRISPTKKKKANMNICISNFTMLVVDPYRSTTGLFAAFALNEHEVRTPILVEDGTCDGLLDNTSPKEGRKPIELGWIGRLVLPAPEKVLRSQYLFVKFYELKFGRVNELARSKLKLDMLSGAAGSDIGALAMKVEPKHLKIKLKFFVESITNIRAKEEQKLEPHLDPKVHSSVVLIQSIFRRAISRAQVRSMRINTKVFLIAHELIHFVFQVATRVQKQNDEESINEEDENVEPQGVQIGLKEENTAGARADEEARRKATADEEARQRIAEEEEAEQRDIEEEEEEEEEEEAEPMRASRDTIAAEAARLLIEQEEEAATEAVAKLSAEQEEQRHCEEAAAAAKNAKCKAEAAAATTTEAQRVAAGEVEMQVALRQAAEAEEARLAEEQREMAEKEAVRQAAEAEAAAAVKRERMEAEAEAEAVRRAAESEAARLAEEQREMAEKEAVRRAAEAEAAAAVKRERLEVEAEAEAARRAAESEAARLAEEQREMAEKKAVRQAAEAEAAKAAAAAEAEAARIKGEEVAAAAKKEEARLAAEAALVEEEERKAAEAEAKLAAEAERVERAVVEERERLRIKEAAVEEHICVQETSEAELSVEATPNETYGEYDEYGEDPFEEEAEPQLLLEAHNKGKQIAHQADSAVTARAKQEETKDPPKPRENEPQLALKEQQCNSTLAVNIHETENCREDDSKVHAEGIYDGDDDDYAEDSFHEADEAEAPIELMKNLREALLQDSMSTADIFNRFCKDGREFVSFTTLCNISKKLYGIKLATENSDDEREAAILSCIDTTGTGQISQQCFEAFRLSDSDDTDPSAELGPLWRHIRRIVEESSSSGGKCVTLDSLDSLFKKYDESRKGRITQRALKRALGKLGNKESLTNEQLSTLESHFSDASGGIRYQQMVSWLNPVRLDKIAKRTSKALRAALRSSNHSLEDAEALFNGGNNAGAMEAFGCGAFVESLDLTSLAGLLSSHLKTVEGSMDCSVAEARALILRSSSTPVKLVTRADGLIRMMKNIDFTDTDPGVASSPKLQSSGSGIGRRSSSNKSKKETSSGADESVPVDLDLYVSLDVEARFRKGQEWFRGRISKVHPNGNVDIEYDDGDFEESVKPKYVRIPK